MTRAVIAPVRRKAAKSHHCDDRAAPWCSGWINKGEMYTRHALPPWTEPNEGPNWWIINACHGCEEWRVDPLTDSPNRQPGEIMP